MTALAVLGLSAALASPPPIQTGPLPHEPITDGDFKVHGLAEGGFRSYLGPEDDFDEHETGAYLHFARLQTVYTHPDGFGSVLQIEAASGTLVLLDATAMIGRKESTQLIVGRFKTPLSSEFLVPAGQLLLPTRSATSWLSTRRATGVQLSHHVRPELLIRGGVYNPSGSKPIQGVGTTTILAVDYHPGGWTFHAAAGTWIHDEVSVKVLGEDAPVGDRTGDVAATWHAHGWTLHTELIGSHRLDDSGWDGAVGAMAAHRFSFHENFDLEPVLAWDTIQQDDALLHRVGVGANLHLDNWHMVQTLAYEGEHDQAMHHTLYLQTQVGF
ncbi:MAG: hypothetical protein VX899_12490 [Myxococcota bacterium]|nr:hypothetical protein [Myxococcota bacterium]